MYSLPKTTPNGGGSEAEVAQVIDIKTAQAAKARTAEMGLARLTQWTVVPDGRRERKEWAEMRAGAAKPFQFRRCGL